jgi:hypothetical protein
MNETFVPVRDGQIFVRHSGKTDGPNRKRSASDGSDWSTVSLTTTV